MKEMNKLHTEERIMNLSMAGSVLFMLVEGLMAYFTHSYSILMDFVFDVTDLIMIGPFLLLVPLLYKPVTERRPYGFSQVESLFLLIKYGVLLFITVQLVIDNVKLIVSGGHPVDAGTIAFFEFGVFVGCLAIYLLLYYYSKRYASMTVRAELYVWKLDVIGSIGVALAFFAQLLLQKTNIAWIAPYIDPVVAIIMSVLLSIEPVKVIGASLKELVLFAPDAEIMEEIRKITETKLEDGSYSLKFLDVIQTGRKTWVEIYVGSHEEWISVRELHRIRDEVREDLMGQFDQVYVEVIPDLPDE